MENPLEPPVEPSHEIAKGEASTELETGTKPKRDKAKDLIHILQHSWTKAQHVLLHPVNFFQTMPTQGGYKEPAVYLAVVIIIFAALQALGRLNPLILILVSVSSIIKTIVGATVVHFALKAMGGKGTTEGTFRVFAYSKTPLLFGWIGLGALQIGGIIALFYQAYLNIVGCEQVHGLPRVKIGIIVAIAAGLGFVISWVLKI